MSLTSILGRLSTISAIQNTNLNAPTAQDVDNISVAVNKLVDRTPKSFIFIQTGSGVLSTNGSTSVPIVQSPVMNRGQRGVVRDLNINFGTVAGTVKICKINSSQVVLTDIVTGITASTSGTGSVVLEEGEAIAILITNAGAGTLGVFFSGDITQVS